MSGCDVMLVHDSSLGSLGFNALGALGADIVVANWHASHFGGWAFCVPRISRADVYRHVARPIQELLKAGCRRQVTV